MPRLDQSDYNRVRYFPCAVVLKNNENTLRTRKLKHKSKWVYQRRMLRFLLFQSFSIFFCFLINIFEFLMRARNEEKCSTKWVAAPLTINAFMYDIPLPKNLNRVTQLTPFCIEDSMQTFMWRLLFFLEINFPAIYNMPLILQSIYGNAFYLGIMFKIRVECNTFVIMPHSSLTTNLSQNKREPKWHIRSNGPENLPSLSHILYVYQQSSTMNYQLTV